MGCLTSNEAAPIIIIQLTIHSRIHHITDVYSASVTFRSYQAPAPIVSIGLPFLATFLHTFRILKAWSSPITLSFFVSIFAPSAFPPEASTPSASPMTPTAFVPSSNRAGSISSPCSLARWRRQIKQKDVEISDILSVEYESRKFSMTDENVRSSPGV